MIKIELTRTLSKRLSITQKDADEFLNIFIDVVGETLENGDKIQLAGFGVFDMRYVPEHQGRNPKTGDLLTVPACHYPFFKAGKSLKDRVAKCKQSVDEKIADVETEKDKAKSSSPSTKPARKKKNSAQSEESM